MSLKTFLITGANRGIGRGLVSALLERPSTRVIAAVRDVEKDSSKALTALPRAADSQLILIKIDSADEEDPARAIEALRREHGIEAVDVVVANAGISHSGTSVLNTSITAFHDHFMVNTVGPIALFQAVAPLLKASKSGRPTFMAVSTILSSIGGMDMFKDLPPSLSPYGGSKAALNWFMRRLCYEEPWLTSFVVHPGLVLTDMALDTFGASGVDPKAMGAIEVEESVKGLMDRIRLATGSDSGTFKNYDGKPLPW
jgi:norsolorinic acid ketoreductase